MGAYGPDVVGAMPTEMHQWIKDSVILWVKNKGGGNPTTESEIFDENKKLRERASAKEIKQFYEMKLQHLTQKNVDLSQENKQYKYQIKTLEKKADKYLKQISEMRTESDTQQEQIMSLYSKINQKTALHA